MREIVQNITAENDDRSCFLEVFDLEIVAGFRQGFSAGGE